MTIQLCQSRGSRKNFIPYYAHNYVSKERNKDTEQKSNLSEDSRSAVNVEISGVTNRIGAADMHVAETPQVKFTEVERFFKLEIEKTEELKQENTLVTPTKS